MAVKRVMGYMPRLEMVSVPFSRSLGSNFPVRTDIGGVRLRERGNVLSPHVADDRHH